MRKTCIRQFWDDNTRTRRSRPLYLAGKKRPSKKKKKQGGEAKTKPTKKAAVPKPAPFVKCLNCRGSSGSPGRLCDPGRPCKYCSVRNLYCLDSPSAAPSAAPDWPSRPQYDDPDDHRCDRCQRLNLPCDIGAPCQACVADRRYDCANSARQGHPFQENTPDDGAGFSNAQTGDNYFSDLVDLAGVPAPVQSIAQSIIAGSQPFEGLSVPGYQATHLTLPTLSQQGTDAGLSSSISQQAVSRKRPAENDDDDDDDAVESRPKKRVERVSGRPRGRTKGTTAARTTQSAASSNSRSQTNRYSRGPRMSGPAPGDDEEGRMNLDNRPSQSLSEAQQAALLASSWKIFDAPSKPTMSQARSGDPDNYQQICTQNSKFWTEPSNIVNCQKVPTKLCEWRNDNTGWTDQVCHDTQELAVANPEKFAIYASKIFVCQECATRFAQSIGTDNQDIHEQVCQCVWGMTRTWLCNNHRRDALTRLTEQVGDRLPHWMAYDRYGKCPTCETDNPPVEGGNAWMCIACLSKVYRDPAISD